MIEDLVVLGAIAAIAAGLTKVEHAADKAQDLKVRHRHGKMKIVAMAAVVSCHPVTVKTIEGYALHVVEVIVTRH